MRSDQHIRLSERAEQFLELNCAVENQGEPSTKKRKQVPGRFYWSGFSSPECLYSYTKEDLVDFGPTCLECIKSPTCRFILPGYELKDGTVVYTKVQAEPWSAGPCFFMTLVKVDTEGKEISIDSVNWTDYEIEKRI